MHIHKPSEPVKFTHLHMNLIFIYHKGKVHHVIIIMYNSSAKQAYNHFEHSSYYIVTC